MSNIEKNEIVHEIVGLHNEISGLLKMSLDKAIRIGELLVEQKESLKHGEFTTWIKANLPFTVRTAQNYMRLFDNQDQLKCENVSLLTDAYECLATRIRKTMIPELWDCEESIARVKRLMSQIVETKHAIGKRILRDYDKFDKPEYGNHTIKEMAKDTGQREKELRVRVCRAIY